MRLSMEEVQKQHESTKKLYEQGLRGATASVEQVLDLFDTIEALQQENEQLRAQVAKMREALEEATETIENIYEKDTPQTEKYRDILNNSGTYEALAEIDKAIGGKEDV